MPFETSFITVISLSAPIVLVVLGETINEKSGVINLSIEGTLLINALAAFCYFSFNWKPHHRIY